MIGKRGTVDVVHTAHFQTDLDPGEDEPSPADILDAIGDHTAAGATKYGLWFDLAESDVLYNKAEVYEEVLKPDIPGTAADAISHAGTNGAPGTLPHELCAYLQLRTDFASRSARGGTHSAPCTRSACFTADLFVTGSVLGTSMTALGNKLKTSFNNGSLLGPVTIHPVIYSRTRRIRGDTPYTFNITNFVVSNQPRFLRTRYK